MVASSFSRRYALRFSLLALVLFALLLVDVMIGSVRIPLSRIFAVIRNDHALEIDRLIVLGVRIPKALTALLAGIALSVSGLLMQTAFRNDLAGPYIFGISSGASLGAALTILVAGGAIIHSPVPLALSAWIGAMTMLTIILLASTRVKSNTTLLILGIMLSAAIGSVVSILQYLSDERALKSFVLWSMGSLSNVTGGSLAVLAIAVVVGCSMALLCIRPLNVLLMGQSFAQSLGLSVSLVRGILFLATSLLAGTVTAFCGPIGFIGMAVPHMARGIFLTTRHGILMIACMLIGGIALLFTDIVAQLPGTSTSLPINAIASLIGIPVIPILLLRRRK